MKAVIFINKTSGSANENDISDKLKTAAKEVNIEADVYDVKSYDNSRIKEMIRERTYDVFIAAGGDGTINSISSALAGTDAILGVIPMGTFNHFARDLGIPDDLNEAMKVISVKNVKNVDIAEVNEKYFLNNSSIGLYPHTVKKRDAYIETLGTGKVISFIMAMFKILKLFPLYRISITDNEKKVITKSPFVFVGNNEYKMNFFELGKREDISKGTLDLYYAKCKNRLCILKLGFLTLFNKLEQSKNFESSMKPEVTINSRKKSISVSIDGEVIRLKPPLVYKIHPGKLNVIVP